MNKKYKIDLLKRLYGFLASIVDDYDNYNDSEIGTDIKDFCSEIDCLLYNEYKEKIK